MRTKNLTKQQQQERSARFYLYKGRKLRETTMEHFTKFNTTGYGPRHLRELNEMAEYRILHEMTEDQAQWECEKILTEFEADRLENAERYLKFRKERISEKEPLAGA